MSDVLSLHTLWTEVAETFALTWVLKVLYKTNDLYLENLLAKKFLGMLTLSLLRWSYLPSNFKIHQSIPHIYRRSERLCDMLKLPTTFLKILTISYYGMTGIFSLFKEKGFFPRGLFCAFCRKLFLQFIDKKFQ